MNEVEIRASANTVVFFITITNPILSNSLWGKFNTTSNIKIESHNMWGMQHTYSMSLQCSYIQRENIESAKSGANIQSDFVSRTKSMFRSFWADVLFFTRKYPNISINFPLPCSCNVETGNDVEIIRAENWHRHIFCCYTMRSSDCRYSLQNSFSEIWFYNCLASCLHVSQPPPVRHVYFCKWLGKMGKTLNNPILMLGKCFKLSIFISWTRWLTWCRLHGAIIHYWVLCISSMLNNNTYAVCFAIRSHTDTPHTQPPRASLCKMRNRWVVITAPIVHLSTVHTTTASTLLARCRCTTLLSFTAIIPSMYATKRPVFAPHPPESPFVERHVMYECRRHLRDW